MKKFCSIFCLLMAFALCINAAWAGNTDRYIVKFKETKAISGDHQRVVSAKQQQLEENLAALKKVVKTYKNLNVNKLWIINSAVVSADSADLAKIKTMPQVERVTRSEYKIWIDKDIDKKPVKADKAQIQWNVTRMRAPEVWEKYKIDGAGVVVGHLDTGIFAEHPALAGKVLKFKDFTPEAKEQAFDGQGHGTHTAGTIVGGEGVGVAPAARLIVARVFDTKGGTTTEILLAAMQWVVDPDGNPETNDGPRLVSNSWGSDDSTDKSFWDIVKAWVDLDITPVFAAGNNGWMGGKVGTPAAFPHSWAVAATTNTDGLAYFSSQGPVAWDGVTLMKPDVAAPGNGIVSCSHNGGMVSNSGTSMACPGVAGVVALMYQADPSLTIEQIRLIGEETAKDLGTPGKDQKFGAGLIDAYKAVEKVMQNAELISSYQAYEAALQAEVALVGARAVSPLAAPLAVSIIERTASLDNGQFNALSLRVADCGEAATQLLKEATAVRTARTLNR
ncbi:MAG: S8 family serine peptidase [Candidatus Riflebacteria bacterium]